VGVVVILAGIVLPTLAIFAISLINRMAETRTTDGTVTNVKSANVPPLSLPTLGSWKGNDRVNILLLGIDSRPKEDPKTARTDTIILTTIDPATKTAGMMSIPRDLWVPFPNPSRGVPTVERINAAHLYGGPKFSMQTVSHNFGIKVDYYVRVHFNVVIELVDMIGGIDIFVDNDINDPNYPDMNYGYDPLVIKSGWQHMNGDLALKYARTRHGGSDFFRMKRQQQVIMAIREKLLQGDTLLRLLPQTPAIFQRLQTSIETDLTITDIVQLALLAKDLGSERISRVAIDETATTPQFVNGASVLKMNPDRVKELREELYNPALNAIKSRLMETGRIAIQNGTNTRGLGQTAQTVLVNKGIVVMRVENASQYQNKTVIIDYHGRPTFMRQLSEVLGVPVSAITTAIDPRNTLDALIILGDDYKQP
jgi:LCP family protein required for cell wall assembly